MKQIKLRGIYGLGYSTLVDDDDFEELNKYKWHLDSNRNGHIGYASRRIGNNTSVPIHRVVMKAKKGQIIDHINRNPLDNRKENLRFCTTQENARNSQRQRNKKSNLPRGINYDETRPHHPFYGRLSFNGKRIETKGCSTKEEAIKLYKELARKCWGEFFNPDF